ncbi:hypothetical protein FN846DRAFT_1023442 [Sphaerosporella brunnea]|uniref:Uncharacterized protein n=1 Tax=Sphaerosporella brunnea TaxID=1250544 RepID=A0A5J5ENS0_9PEZI|nr:hypothetical protein FN846DRAFT_1023442 [Sphaerosporella brunnea]
MSDTIMHEGESTNVGGGHSEVITASALWAFLANIESVVIDTKLEIYAQFHSELGMVAPTLQEPRTEASSDRPVFYHDRIKYAGPALALKIRGGGLDPQVVVREDGKLGCSLCKSVVTSRVLIERHILKHTIGEFPCPWASACDCPKLHFHRWDKFRDHLKKRHQDVDMDDPTVIAVFLQYHRGATAYMGKLGQNQRTKRLTKKEKLALAAEDVAIGEATGKASDEC